METAGLRSFAAWARTELIKEVGARVAAVLAPGSSERVEEVGAITALERAITAGGGGAVGRAKVADTVAYTWFNRIIALRFMDANGYTGIGVVSPRHGEGTGQPEVLADAKRGVIDREVVGKRTVERITALLDGTRRSTDPQGEAFSLLLAEYCRRWHGSMPFMFEREGDYTELLIPANLLSDDSVLARAVSVLTEKVCADVEVIGWLYQFYISERKDEVFAGFKKNKKAGADEIPAATQLFTPHWIVRYLVENSLGRLWMLNHPSSRVVDQMDYYIAPVDEETDFPKITKPEELTVIDPACGSGHMLTYAFDLLYAIYEEQGYTPSEIPGLILTRNLYGTEIDPRAGALAAFALTMKARARQRTFFSKQVQPNICVLNPISFTSDELDFLITSDGDRHAEEAFWNQFEHADTFGSLIQPDAELTEELGRHLETLDVGGDMLIADTLYRAGRVLHHAEYLLQRYHISVANPPYMGSGNMGPILSGFVGAEYPDAKQDLYGCFAQRATGLVSPFGMVAMVIGDTWMSISSFEKFRRRLLDRHSFASFVHLRDISNHPDIFGANAAFVLDMAGSTEASVSYFRLTPLKAEEKRVRFLAAIADPASTDRHFCTTDDLDRVPGVPIAYWLSDAVRAAFAQGRPLASEVTLREGLTTGDNERYLRYWWEVSANRSVTGCESREEALASGARWFPHKKGGPFRRWYGNQDLVINWSNDGAEIKAAVIAQYGGSYTKSIRSENWYLKPALSWGRVSSGEFSIRSYPPGQLFDSTAPSVFASESVMESALAWLNSSSMGAVLAAISPTLDFRLTAMGSLPMPNGWKSLDNTVTREATSVSRDDWNSFETSWDFAICPILGSRPANVADVIDAYSAESSAISREQQGRETENNLVVAEAYDLVGEVPIDVPLHRVSLTRNVEFRYGAGRSVEEYGVLERADVAAELVSYAVGCMFGRYSLDQPGLILADQGATLQDYLAKVPIPTFAPDKDNVIPIVDGEWFEDDIVERFRQFLRASFGEQHFEENLRFVTASLGVKNLRDYFVKSFYKDHVQRYKKRPIYWLFSSPKGSFSALIYMHRYTPSTVSTVLNEYLREFQSKLQASLTRAERSNNAREADRLRRVLVELNDYEHDVLYPLATQQIAIDLDDGVKANYPKFGTALKKIPGMEVAE